MTLILHLVLIIVFLKYFCKFRHVVVYCTKYVCYVLICSFFSIIFLPYFCLRPKNVDNLRVGSSYCVLATKLLGIKWILRNTHYLTENKGFIIVSNHQSCLDILGMMYLWPYMRKCTAVAKNGLFYCGPFGVSAWMAGMIFIPRNTNPEKSKSIIVEAGEMIKKKRIKLWIFAEGKRFSDGNVHAFKKGAFHLAIQSQIPIIPVVFSSYSFVNHEQKRFNSGTAIASVLAPISTDGKTLDDLGSLIEETHNKISRVYKEVNEECEKLNNAP